MTLKDAGVRLIDCVHKTPAAQAEGYPYVAIPQMNNGRIDFTEARRISHADFVEWTKKARPQLHDVVLSRRTNPGVTATFGAEVNFALGQNLVLLRADGSLVNPDFLRWLVVSPDWWAEIEKYNNVGAVFDSLKCADVPKFCLPIPPREVQSKISELLAGLDDKIELNRRMNETLEAMAQAIFRDWFVDFGPVRRKMAGATDPAAIMGGLTPDSARAAELAALFPNALSDDNLPLGWSEKSIGELVDIAGGSTFSLCKDLLRQNPEQAESREDLQRLLARTSGGVIFTTVQKFSPERGEESFPMLTDRRNVIVMADEAHRSQYGFDAKLDAKTGARRYGYAHYIRATRSRLRLRSMLRAQQLTLLLPPLRRRLTRPLPHPKLQLQRPTRMMQAVLRSKLHPHPISPIGRSLSLSYVTANGKRLGLKQCRTSRCPTHRSTASTPPLKTIIRGAGASVTESLIWTPSTGKWRTTRRTFVPRRKTLLGASNERGCRDNPRGSGRRLLEATTIL